MYGGLNKGIIGGDIKGLSKGLDKGLYKGLYCSNTILCRESINWLIQIHILGYGSPSWHYIVALDKMIRKFKEQGIWPHLDRMYIFATNVQGHARVSIVNPTAIPLTEINSPVWTKGKGYTFNGTNNYLNTNFNPFFGGCNFAVLNASMGFYRLTNSGLGCDIGAYDGTYATQIYSNLSGTDYCSFNSSTAQTSSIAAANGLYFGYRYGGNTYLYQAGVQRAVVVGGTAAIPNYALFVAARNQASIGQYVGRQYAMAFVGDGMIPPVLFYNTFQVFAKTIGFVI
jgi:hypothetical protein